MNKLLSGLCALLLLTGLAAACDSNRVGDNPTRDRAPSASPPTSPDTGSTSTPPSSTSPAPGSETPKSPPSMPSR
jgi:hypothetical protein